MNEAEAKFIWIMLNEAGGGRSQPCFHYAEREDFGGCEADSTIRISECRGKPTMNEVRGGRSQPCFHYAKREDFGDSVAAPTKK